VNHHASPDFWACYYLLQVQVREQADKAFEMLKANPRHPSLHFKKAGRYWSVRVGLQHRAVGIRASDGIVWFWIGTHGDYDKIVNNKLR
jgi:hypothetical protein